MLARFRRERLGLDGPAEAGELCVEARERGFGVCGFGQAYGERLRAGADALVEFGALPLEGRRLAAGVAPRPPSRRRRRPGRPRTAPRVRGAPAGTARRSRAAPPEVRGLRQTGQSGSPSCPERVVSRSFRSWAAGAVAARFVCAFGLDALGFRGGVAARPGCPHRAARGGSAPGRVPLPPRGGRAGSRRARGDCSCRPARPSTVVSRPRRSCAISLSAEAIASSMVRACAARSANARSSSRACRSRGVGLLGPIGRARASRGPPRGRCRGRRWPSCGARRPPRARRGGRLRRRGRARVARARRRRGAAPPPPAPRLRGGSGPRLARVRWPRAAPRWRGPPPGAPRRRR